MNLSKCYFTLQVPDLSLLLPSPVIYRVTNSFAYSIPTPKKAWRILFACPNRYSLTRFVRRFLFFGSQVHMHIS
jgi:hypothetical protein